MRQRFASGRRLGILVVLAGCASQSVPDGDAAADASDMGVDAADTTPGLPDGDTAFDPPRPVVPNSTSLVTSLRPTFRWALAPGTDGAVVEVCRDRPCNIVLARIEATGTTARPDQELPAGLLFWRLRGRRGALAGRTASVTRQFHTGQRAARGSAAWGTVLDINGDGGADVVAASPTAPAAAMDGGVATDNGAVFVYVSSPTGFALFPSFTLDAPAGVGRFGAAVASAGDVDGDGFGDLAVGAPGAALAGDAGVGLDADDGGDAGAARDVGRVLVYRGSLTGIALEPAVTLRAPARGSLFGARVASAGDVDGDGYGDLVVGAPGAQAAYYYPGRADGVAASPGATFSNFAAASAFGTAVAGAGDVNGDGFADVLVGAPGEGSGRGQAYLYFGNAPGPLARATALAVPDPAADRRFGEAVACAGDVNADGFADVIVGAPESAPGAADAGPEAFRPGRAYVFLGGVGGIGAMPAARLEPPAGAASGFGAAVAGVGDVNGDGYGDVLVGAPGDDATGGRAYVFLGGALGPAARHAAALMGTPSGGTRFGQGVALLSDVDGDALADVAVAEPRAADVGRVLVFRGATTGVTTEPAFTVRGPPGAGQFGTALARSLPWGALAPEG